MTASMNPMMQSLFDQANHFWFNTGQTGRALALYNQLHEECPSHPVIAYQLSVIWYALNDLNQSLQYILLADQYVPQTAILTRRKVQSHLSRFGDGQSLVTSTPPVSQYAMDMDILLKLSPAEVDWYDVALDAIERDIPGVANRAFQLYNRGFLDPELLREEEIARIRAESQLDDIIAMVNEYESCQADA